jgi:hypothetical protein
MHPLGNLTASYKIGYTIILRGRRRRRRRNLNLILLGTIWKENPCCVVMFSFYE